MHSASAAAASTVAAAGDRGESRCGFKHVCTFRDKSHDLQPCATYLGFVWQTKSRSIVAAYILLLEISNGRERAWGIRGLSAAVPKTTGFRPDGINSSGMPARTPWQVAATAAAGEVTEGSGLGVSSAGPFLVRQHVEGVGYRFGRHRWGFRRN